MSHFLKICCPRPFIFELKHEGGGKPYLLFKTVYGRTNRLPPGMWDIDKKLELTDCLSNCLITIKNTYIILVLQSSHALYGKVKHSTELL